MRLEHATNSHFSNSSGAFRLTSANLLHNFAGKGVLNVPGGVLRYIIFTCAQKLMNSQLNLPHGTKQKRKPVMKKLKTTTMCADAKRNGRPTEYRWRPLRKFCNSIPCTTPQFGWCRLPIYENARVGRKVNFAPGKIPSGGKSPEIVYTLCFIKNVAVSLHVCQ